MYCNHSNVFVEHLMCLVHSSLLPCKTCSLAFCVGDIDLNDFVASSPYMIFLGLIHVSV